MMNYIGIDLGGTNIAAALTGEDGQILRRCGQPTPRTPEAVADAIAALASELLAQSGEEVPYIGIGAPGAIDPAAVVIARWTNLDFNDVPLVELVSARTGLPVLLENDANCAAIGEFAAGAGKGFDSMVAITLGTGVGGGAILNGKLYTGANYAGLEVGHFVIHQGGRRCSCGRAGCFEAYCSATALIARAREAMAEDPHSLLWNLGGAPEQVDGKTVIQAAEQGDGAASRVLAEFTEALGCGVTSLVNIFQPDVLCVGGGIANAGEAILAPVREILDREDYAKYYAKRTRLCRAQLGNDAGLIGAAMLRRFRAELH